MKNYKDILSEQIKGQIPEQVLTAKVKSINKTKQICTVVLDDGLEIPKVRLVPNPEVSGECLLFPKENTNCLIGLISEGTGTRYYIISANEYTSVEFFGGNLGGMVKINQLVQKLNAIENLLNQFITAYGTHIHNDTVTLAPSTPPIIPFTQIITPTTVQDLENPKVKH